VRFLIIGVSDAGFNAALRARELKSNAEITVLLEDDFPNQTFAVCPFT
jgi:NADPH-dependent 2,4-dienoyl-CoA reductase/sulfur reductase-like enzyme